MMIVNLLEQLFAVHSLYRLRHAYIDRVGNPQIAFRSLMVHQQVGVHQQSIGTGQCSENRGAS